VGGFGSLGFGEISMRGFFLLFGHRGSWLVGCWEKVDSVICGVFFPTSILRLSTCIFGVSMGFLF
jgi:hypothetical protein